MQISPAEKYPTKEYINLIENVLTQLTIVGLCGNYDSYDSEAKCDDSLNSSFVYLRPQVKSLYLVYISYQKYYTEHHKNTK